MVSNGDGREQSSTLKGLLIYPLLKKREKGILFYPLPKKRDTNEIDAHTLFKDHCGNIALRQVSYDIPLDTFFIDHLVLAYLNYNIHKLEIHAGMISFCMTCNWKLLVFATLAEHEHSKSRDKI